jgi:hypothetical protein
MFDAAGIRGTVVGTLGQVTGNIDPKLAAEQTNLQRNALDRYRFAFQSLKQGKQFASEVKMLDNLAPSSSDMATNPLREINKAIQMHGWAQSRLKVARQTLLDPDRGQKAKEAADEQISLLNNFLTDMPPVENMIARRNFYLEKGNPEGEGIGDTLPGSEDVSRATSKAMGGKRPAGPATEGAVAGKQFNTMTEAQLKQIQPEDVERMSNAERAALLARIEQLKGAKGRAKSR